MVNTSKKNDLRFWKKWKESGAIGTYLSSESPNNLKHGREANQLYNKSPSVFEYSDPYAHDFAREVEREQTIRDLLRLNESHEVRVPILEIVDIKYIPTGTHLHALIGPRNPNVQGNPNLVYVEGGSQHGILGLLDMGREQPNFYPHHHEVNGYYDRDPTTRKITAIYLQEDALFTVNFQGTLDDLMSHPNVKKR